MHTALLTARLALAAVFALAAVTKLADLGGSREAVAAFGVPKRLAAPLGTALPFAELAVAIALLPAGSAAVGAFGALLLLTLFMVAVARSIARGESPDCHCFGQLHSRPAGPRTLARNAVLAAVAGFVVGAGWSNAGPSALAWIGRLNGAGAVALAAGVGLAALATATAFGLFALLRQNGRLLIRVDQLEARLDAAGAPALPTPQSGLPIGAPAPDFTLNGLYGETVTLESLTASERPVMLLFTDPKCGPCNALMPQISAWQQEHTDELTIAVLTRGSVADNRAKAREHGIESVWFDERLAVYDAYSANGTPGAVLIDTGGRIASQIAAGPDAIAALVAAATDVPGRTPAVGTDAPRLELRGLDGEALALADPDRDTLVLFWNPGCGFCQRMLDDVRALERAPDSPRLLLISTGSAADNKAMELQSPIALDQAFAAGQTFGTTGTPSGVLVDRRGRIASELGVGAPALLALATREGSVTSERLTER